MNIVTLIGRFTADPVISFTDKEMAVAKFTLAVNREGKDKSADFINCAAFGKTAELIGQYCSRGQLLGLNGRWQTGSYEKDGRKIYTNTAVASRVEFLSKSEKKPEWTAEDPMAGFTHADDIPF